MPNTLLLLALLIRAVFLSAIPYPGTESAPVSLYNVHNRVLAGLVISDAPEHGIRLVNCSNMTIRNCRIINVSVCAVTLINCKNITVTGCMITKAATGVHALNSTRVAVLNNRFRNINGRFPHGQMIQFDKVSGPGNRIINNQCDNLPGESNAEDAINLFKTNGTSTDPIQVAGNRIYGGGPSNSGGGIMLGDSGGSNQLAKSNVLVNPGQYGIAIAGGTGIQVLDNVIYARRQPFTNVGIYVWAQSGAACGSNTVMGNKVNWVNAKGEANHAWNAGNCGEVRGWDRNEWGARIDSVKYEAK